MATGVSSHAVVTVIARNPNKRGSSLKVGLFNRQLSVLLAKIFTLRDRSRLANIRRLVDYQITLDDLDLAQILEGLKTRAESWERTAEYLRTHEIPAGELYALEECDNSTDADLRANHYREIIGKIRRQIRS